MNRQQRRNAGKDAARVRAHEKVRARWPVRNSMVLAAELVMRPVDQIIDQIERDGTVDVDERGFPHFQAGDGNWYDSAAGIEGVIWHFEMWCIRHGKELPLQPLRDLHVALKYLVPVQARTLADLKTSMPQLRRALALANPEDALDLLHQAEIKDAMEARAA
jgi:hypothetical protein